MILYHGTDIDSALDILNHGLDAAKLTAPQLEMHTRLFALILGRSCLMAKLTYTVTDLRIGATTDVKREDKTVVHTHRVIFARPLTRAEQHLFADVLVGFYYTVHFSQQFGNGLVAEPVVEFISDHEARYTLRQCTLSGPWKDLLFAVLANFSYEVAPIQWHDDSRAFDPESGSRRTADDTA
jgi:hypothetical protein